MDEKLMLIACIINLSNITHDFNAPLILHTRTRHPLRLAAALPLFLEYSRVALEVGDPDLLQICPVHNLRLWIRR